MSDTALHKPAFSAVSQPVSADPNMTQAHVSSGRGGDGGPQGSGAERRHPLLSAGEETAPQPRAVRAAGTWLPANLSLILPFGRS